MRKKIIDHNTKSDATEGEKWLDLEFLALVEITSEEADYPIENALEINAKSVWRASKAGNQIIRIIFDEPQRIHKIHLLFEEQHQARTQEFVWRWSAGNGQPFREIVRQQYNFSPDSTTVEEENYTVQLEGVKVVELTITPDIAGGNALASLSRLWMA